MTSGSPAPGRCPGAGAGRPRVALVTCAGLPQLDPDDQLLAAALTAGGATVDPVVWDDPRVDWDAYTLSVLRSTWDYPGRRAEFLRWAASVPRLWNPASLVRWNTDKRYLDDLAAAGVPTVPTTWSGPGGRWQAPADGTWVVKPSVGAGSRECARYRCDDPVQRRAAEQHAQRLRSAGYRVMVQPYLPAVDVHGETALLFFADPDTGALRFSHAVRKGPMLPPPGAGAADVDGGDRGDDRGDGPGLYASEHITARTPTDTEHAVARTVVGALQTAGPAAGPAPLYARVDLLPGPDGAPVLVELELTEPSLFLAHASWATTRCAAAVLAAAGCGAAGCGAAG